MEELHLREGLIFALLDRAGWSYKKAGKNYMGVCPSCNQGKKTHNTSFDPVKNCFHCFSCNESGGLKKLAELLKIDFSQFLETEGVINREFSFKPKEPKMDNDHLEKPLIESPSNVSKEDARIPLLEQKPAEKLDIFSLASQNLSPETIKYLQGRYIQVENEDVRKYLFELRPVNEYFQKIYRNGYRLLIPMYGLTEGIRSVKIRKITPIAEGERKVLNLTGYSPICLGWNNLEVMQKKNAVLIVEGETDFISVLSCCFKHVLGVPSATYNFHEEELDALPENVFLLLDNDAAGQTNAKRLARQIYSYKKPRRKIYLCSYPKGIKDANELLVFHKGNYDRFLIDIEAAMQAGSLRRYVPFETCINLMESMIGEIEKKLEEAEEQGKDRPDVCTISTGLQPLDLVLNGGLRSGLYGIAGRPGVGKTCMILSLAKSILEANPEIYVIVFSIEMTSKELVAQLLSWGSGISRYKILDNDIDRNGLQKLKGALNASIFHRVIVEDKAQTVGEFKKVAIDVMNETERKCVVFIDYLQKIQPLEKKYDLRIAMKEIAYDLKDFANTYEIPVFVLSSTQRESYKQENKNDLLSSFKESGDIEYSLYVGIYLDELGEEEIQQKRYEIEIDEYGKSIEKSMKFTLVKNRHGTARDKEGNYLSLDLALSFKTGVLRNLDEGDKNPLKLGFLS